YSVYKPEPVYSRTLELDLSTVKPCLAGPKRPQDQLFFNEVPESFREIMRQTFTRKKESGLELSRDPAYQRWIGEGGTPVGESEIPGIEEEIVESPENSFRVTHGSV